MRGRPQLHRLLKNLVGFAARRRRQAVLVAAIAAGAPGVVAAAVAREGGAIAAEAFAQYSELLEKDCCSKAARSASRCGQIETVRVLCKLCASLNAFDLSLDAAHHGQLEVCEYFRSVVGDDLLSDFTFVDAAVASGNIALLEFVASGPAGTTVFNSLCRGRLECVGADGNVSALDWLARHGAVDRISRKSLEIAFAAIDNDHVAVVAYLQQNIRDFATNAIESGLAVKAATAGACKVLAFLGAGYSSLPDNREYLARGAARSGRVRVLDWLVARGLDEDEFCATALGEAAVAGRLDVLEWARRRFNVPRAVFAKHAGRHETTDAFIASLDARAVLSAAAPRAVLSAAPPRAFVDLPEELLGLMAAAGRDHAFCALRQTCRRMARLSFDVYALAAIARVKGRRVLFGLLENMLSFAAHKRRWAVLDAAIAAGGADIVAVASARENAVEAFSRYPVLSTKYSSNLIVAAIRCGRLEIIRALLASLGMLDCCLYFAGFAARYGQREVFELCYSHGCAGILSRDIVDRAFESGNISLLDFIVGRPEGASMVAHVSKPALINVGAAGVVAVLEWLESHGARARVRKHAHLIAHTAAKNDHVAVLAYLEKSVGCFGKLAVTPLESSTQSLEYSARGTAATVGACNALAFLAARFPLSVNHRLTLAQLAARHGRIRVLDWLVADGLDEDEFCVAALAAAADAGRLDVFEWARRRFNVPRTVFAKYTGRHETVDAFLASFDSAAA